MRPHPFYFSFAAILLLISFISMPAMAQHTGSVKIDVSKSKLDWEGHRFYGGKHTGNISLSGGEIQVEEGKLIGGEFIIDMNSIQVTDIEGEPAERLTAHLKTEDFFDASNFPKATLKIKYVDYASDELAAVVAEITIRGVSQQISFPATIHINDKSFHAIAEGIRVDRTVHGSKYGSIQFFRGLGRKLVADEILLNVEIFGLNQ